MAAVEQHLHSLALRQDIFLSICLQDMADYIAYVAKDLFNQRGKAHFIIVVTRASTALLFWYNYHRQRKSPSVSLSACHILECPHGRAGEVINSIGQAFETRFRQLLSHAPSLLSTSPRLSFCLVSNWGDKTQWMGTHSIMCIILVEVMAKLLHSRFSVRWTSGNFMSAGQRWDSVVNGAQRRQQQTKRPNRRSRSASIVTTTTWSQGRRRPLVD